MKQTALRQQLIRKKLQSPINNSKSKMQYSFGKSKRFNDRQHASANNITYYNIPQQKSKRATSFGYGQRIIIQKRTNTPPPNRYNILSKMLSTGITFKLGRQEVKYGSLIKQNFNPGPGQYNPQKITPKISFSLGKKFSTNPKQASSPGPIYNIESTMLDKNKFLSIYIRRNSTKIVQIDQHKKLKTQATPSPSSYSFSIITRRGQKQFGNVARKTFMTAEKRNSLLSSLHTQVPGPGQYQSFSQFIQTVEN